MLVGPAVAEARRLIRRHDAPFAYCKGAVASRVPDLYAHEVPTLAVQLADLHFGMQNTYSCQHH